MSQSLRVLLVEDSEDDALFILHELRRGGYQLVHHRVQTRPTMLTALEEQTWDVVLSDYALPQFSGLAALQLYKEKDLDIPFIVISGTIGEATAVEMMKAGAHDYLMKNNLARLGVAVERELREAEERRQRKQAEQQVRYNEERFRSLIQNSSDIITVLSAEGAIQFISPSVQTILGYAPEHYLEQEVLDFVHPEDVDALRRSFEQVLTSSDAPANAEFRICSRDGEWLYLETITANLLDTPSVAGLVINARDITERKRAEAEILQAHHNLANAYDATLEGWSRALELREQETAGHSKRVVDLTEQLARVLGVEGEELTHIRRGALLHDIGKMGLPDNILLKPGPLNPEEKMIMRQHPSYAYRLLAGIAYLKPALDIPYYHHERWDGSGYPKGLCGVEIPLAARIFAVIDCWDALMHDRVYRPAWPVQEVVSYLRQEAGKSFDPEVVDAFLRIVATA